MNLTSLDDWERDVPNFSKQDSGSSCSWATPPTGRSVAQAEATDLRRARTSSTGGRSRRSVCQQSSSNIQSSSERPSSSAFVGLEGLSPSKTLTTTSDLVCLPNGSVPVSTYKEELVRVYVKDCLVSTWYIVIAIAYTSASIVDAHFSSLNLDGKRSSGAMKGVVPPPASDFDDSIPRLGSCTMVINPKSARHAETGLVLVIRILA